MDSFEALECADDAEELVSTPEAAVKIEFDNSMEGGPHHAVVAGE